MVLRKKVCVSCKAQYFHVKDRECGVCGENYCPNCEQCECSVVAKKTLFPNTIIKSLSINKIPNSDKTLTYEISGTLSPLVGQKLVKTKYGRKILSEFDFSDETGKYRIIFFGPVPAKIFPHRYEYIDLTIKGVKIGENALIIKNNAKFHFSLLKTKHLEYYMQEV